MKNKITRKQTEYTYEVIYAGNRYTVLQVESLEEGFIDWNVFDSFGNDLNELDQNLKEEIISFVIQNA